MLEQIIIAAVSGVVYSLVFYAKTKAKDADEEFSPVKLAATLVAGIFVAVAYEYSGVNLDQQTLSNQLAAYAGTIAILESVIKILWRRFLKGIWSSS